MTETTMTLSVPDGKGGMIETGAFTLDQAKAALEKVKERRPMKETTEDRAVAGRAYGVASEELRQFVERIERLEAEKQEAADGQKEVYAEAKGRGYSTKVLRKVIALRKRDKDDLAEEEAIEQLYRQALGI